MHRFFHHHTTFINSDDYLYKRLVYVLRIKKNELISLFFDDKEYVYIVEDINKKGVYLKFYDEKKYIKNLQKINIYQSIIKKDKIEQMLNLSTQVGVCNIYLIKAQYSQKIIFSKNNIDRFNKILIEASEQSGRINIPKIINKIDLNNVNVNSNDLNIVLHNNDNDYNKYNLKKFNINDKNLFNLNNININIFVGPEAGFGEKDIVYFLSNNFIFWNLNTYILRSENAGAIACAVLNNINLH